MLFLQAYVLGVLCVIPAALEQRSSKSETLLDPYQIYVHI